MAKRFIGIQRLWYGPHPDGSQPIGTDVTVINKWLAADTTVEVKNSHQDTFTYEQEDPSVTDYINELTGRPYYRDTTEAGNKTISWTMGEYGFADRVRLIGGTACDSNGKEYDADTIGNASESDLVSWVSPEGMPPLVEMTVAARTKTGNLIVFPNAGIVAKTDTQEKALGLGITATAQDPGEDGESDEVLYDGSVITWPN